MPFKCKLIYGKRSKNYLTPHNVRLHELFEYPFKSAFMYAVNIECCVCYINVRCTMCVHHP